MCQETEIPKKPYKASPSPKNLSPRFPRKTESAPKLSPLNKLRRTVSLTLLGKKNTGKKSKSNLVNKSQTKKCLSNFFKSQRKSKLVNESQTLKIIF